MGGRAYAKRSQVVPSDHGLVFRDPARKVRVPVRLDLLLAGRAVRHRNRQLAYVGARLPCSRPGLDGSAWLVAAVLKCFRASADEPRRPDPRGSSGARPAGSLGCAGPVVRLGSLPGLGRVQGTREQRRGPLVSNPEAGARHRPRPPPPPPDPPPPLPPRPPPQPPDPP